MTPKNFFYTEAQQGTSNLTSRTGGEAITVTPNFPSDPESQEIFLGIAMDDSSADKGEAWTAVDAGKLRDAIDKAVGPREPKPWEGSKPYRPLDRDRLLRHIEDVEAALTRRNERHEEDQETIRELEATITGLRIIIEGLEAEAAKPSREEQLELLDQVGPGKEVVLDAPRLLDTPEARAKAIPALEIVRVTSYIKQDGSQGFRLYVANDDFGWHGRSEEALALGLAAEDFKPAAELRRKEYEDAGLARDSRDHVRTLERAKPKAPEWQAVVASCVHDEEHKREVYSRTPADAWESVTRYTEADSLVDPVPLVELPEREALVEAIHSASPAVGPVEGGALADAVLELLKRR